MKKNYLIHFAFLIALIITSNLSLAQGKLTCTANAIATPTLICNGQSATLSGSLSGLGLGTPSYNWMPIGTTGQSVLVTPSSFTTYTLEVKAGPDTCYAVISVSVSACTGVEEFSFHDFSIYPNPATNEINIISRERQQNNLTEIKLINELGEIVYSGVEQKISASGLPAGLYIVNINLNNKTLFKKVMVTH